MSGRAPQWQCIASGNNAVNGALTNAKTKAWLAEIGGTPLAGSSADFGKLIVDDTEKWGKVVKFSGAKVERWGDYGAKV